MRLVDKDALPIVARGKNGHRKYVFADITDAPIIPAIPMEWITEKFLDTLNKDKELSKAAWLVCKAWIAEQEA